MNKVRGYIASRVIDTLAELELRNPGSVESIARSAARLRRFLRIKDVDDSSSDRPVEASLSQAWLVKLSAPSPIAVWYPHPGNLIWAFVAVCVLAYFGYTAATTLSKEWLPEPGGGGGGDEDDDEKEPADDEGGDGGDDGKTEPIA